jgi:hypothetical protein
VLPEPFVTALWFANHAVGVVKQSLLHTTRIMTSLLMSNGFANLATKNGIKN